MFEIPTKNRFQNLNNSDDTEVISNKDKEEMCDLCGCCYTSKAALETHKRNTHGLNKRSREGDGKNEENNSISAQLENEKKDHKKTKKAFEVIEREYKDCKEELKVIQEKYERIKIKDKDIRDVLDLSKQPKDVSVLEDNMTKEVETIICSDCQYPFHNEIELSSHMKKHKSGIMNQEANLTCSICNEDMLSGKDFRRHINEKHLSEFNCQECDFQASSQIILSKHTNLRHRKPNEYSEPTHKCEQCTAQFSAIWNLYNHVRDTHGVKEQCKYFKQGRCQFPENICWKNMKLSSLSKHHIKMQV